jgi:hypothetical protein
MNFNEMINSPRIHCLLFTLLFLVIGFLNINLCNGQTDKINDSLNYKAKMVRYISEGNLDSLINDTDTLRIFFNRSGCIFCEHDFVFFFKQNNTLYVKCNILIGCSDFDTIFCPLKEYQFNKTDTLSWGFLLSQIHKIAKDYRDSLVETRNILSIGVFHKWGKMYYLDPQTYEFSYFLDLYDKIMHSIYPDIENFTPITKIEYIFED